MKVLLIGKHEEALKIYRNMLCAHGIQAFIGDDCSPFERYDAVVHLWPMNSVRLGKRLDEIDTAAAQKQ